MLRNSGGHSNLDLNISCIISLDRNLSMISTPSAYDKNSTKEEEENLDGTQEDDFNEIEHETEIIA